MYGYLRVHTPELKVREQEYYRAVYEFRIYVSLRAFILWIKRVGKFGKFGMANLGITKRAFFLVGFKLYATFYTVHSFTSLIVAFYGGVNTKLAKGHIKTSFKLGIFCVSDKINIKSITKRKHTAVIGCLSLNT